MREQIRDHFRISREKEARQPARVLTSDTIQDQIDEFFANDGAIREIPMGMSGKTPDGRLKSDVALASEKGKIGNKASADVRRRV